MSFLFALLLMLITSVNYSLSLGHALSFLLTGLFAATLLHTYRNLAGLVVEAARADPVFAGERLGFELRVRNPSALARCGIDVATDRSGSSDKTGPESARLHVAAATASTIRIDVPTERRGPLALGRVTLSSDYPLGLWRAWTFVHVPVVGTVYPAPEPDAPDWPAGAAARATGETEYDTGEFVRYREGDPLARVAWKLAARVEPLHVRLLADEARAAPLALDLERAGPGDIEHRLSRLAAWVLRCGRSGRRFSLRLPDADLDEAEGPRAVAAALTAMALTSRRA